MPYGLYHEESFKMEEKQKEYNKSYYQRNKSIILEKRKKHYIENKDKLRETHKKNSREYYKIPGVKEHKNQYKVEYYQKEENKLKIRCRWRTQKAIKRGILKRPDKCEDCKKICFTSAHHEDYTKHLEVKWLCVDCHALKHRKYK